MPQAVTEPKPKKYRLKSMVLARMLAEMSVLLILFVLPGILILTGYFQTTTITIKVVLFSLSLIAALILPAYAFITWRVKTDQNGLTTMSLARKEHCQWSSIKRISRRSNWNWVRYVVEHQDGEISFPIWLVNVDDLIAMVRERLPKGGAAGSPFRKFSQDRISLLFQCMQSALGVGLVVVFWFFFSELAQNQSTNQTDLSLVFAFCLIITMLFLWRTSVVFLMPKSVELTPSGIIVDTMLFSRRIGWQSVLKITPSYPLLPEGFMLKTELGSFLIGNGMDSADELVLSLRGKIESGQPLTTASSVKSSADLKKRDPMDFSPDGTKSISADRSIHDKQTGHETINTGHSTAKDLVEAQRLDRSAGPNEATKDDTTGDVPKSDEEDVDTTPTDDTPDKAQTLPSGKKADRRFRRKKKNKPS